MVIHIDGLDARRMQSLTPVEAARFVMQLPAKQRMASILDRPDSATVVAALPEEDFYFTVKELGHDDSLALLALAGTDQLNFLFDLEWWKKDHLLPAKAAEWLERLSRASNRKLLGWLYQADFELLVTLMKKLIRVVPAPEEIDILEAREHLPPHTLDDQYFWESIYPQYESLAGNILRLLFEVNYGFYRELLNSVLWAADSEVEEEAYRFHGGRLEDRAIPDYFDALEIYRSMHPREILHNKESLSAEEQEGAVPSFALLLVPEEDLLHRALLAAGEPHILDTLRMELASVSNKVIIADQLSLDDPGSLQFAAGKAAAYVNLGLEAMSDGDLKAAVHLLEQVFLEDFFRLGYTRIAKLRGKLTHVVKDGWISRWPASIHFLDHVWLEPVELLLQKTPRLLRSSAGAGPAREDFFRKQADLAQGKQLAAMLAAMGEVFDALYIDPERIRGNLWKEGQVRRLEDVTLGSLIWTAALNFAQTGKWEAVPIDADNRLFMLPNLKAAAFEDTIRSWVDRTIADSPTRAYVLRYLTPLFAQYAEEMASYSPEALPDLRLLRFFLFSARGA